MARRCRPVLGKSHVCIFLSDYLPIYPVNKEAYFFHLARAYMDELMPDILEGCIEPGRVFDWVGHLEAVPDGYRAMNAREAIKAMIEF